MAKPKKKYNELTKLEIKYIKKVLNITSIQDIDIVLLKKLKEKLKEIKDIRNKNMISFKLWDVIICVIIASFADNDTWEEIHEFVEENYKWFKSFLQMTGGVPKADSYERIMGLVDHEELNSILLDFFNAMTLNVSKEEDILNLDGRLNNGSKRKRTVINEAIKPLNCLNVYSLAKNYCISTIPIDSKTNEIPTIRDYLKDKNLKGKIITVDALNTQKDNVKAVIDAYADYVFPVKGNQEDFKNNLKEYFNQDKCDEIIAGNLKSEYEIYYEKSHGQIIKYEFFQTSDIEWYDRTNNWEGLQSIGFVRKTITMMNQVNNERKNAKKKKIEKEITNIEEKYYISSLNVDIKRFSKIVRSHWSIENKIHWHLDYTFKQDRNKTTNKNALLNLEIIHKFVLAILEKTKPKYKRSLLRIRKHLGRNIGEYFTELACFLIVSR